MRQGKNEKNKLIKINHEIWYKDIFKMFNNYKICLTNYLQSQFV